MGKKNLLNHEEEIEQVGIFDISDNRQATQVFNAETQRGLGLPAAK